MRLIDADALKEDINSRFLTNGEKRLLCRIVDKNPTVTGIIDAKDFKKRINNMEYVYIQSCAEDVIDAIDCEVTYFKEKMTKGPNSVS